MSEPEEVTREAQKQNPETSAISEQEVECAAILSKELAVKILRKVEFTKSLVASEYSIRGVFTVRIASLEQAKDFLKKCNDQFLQDVSQVSQDSVMYHLDLHIFASWIKEVLGDDVLASDISKELGEKCPSSLVSDISKYYKEHIGSVNTLVAKRLEQCEATLGEDIGIK